MKKLDYDYRIKYLKKYSKNPLSFLTLSDSLSILRGEWEGYIAYKDILGTVIVLGEPIVPNKSLHQSIKDLKERFSSKKFHICLVPCTEKLIDPLQKEGFKCVYIGSEAVVDLTKFSISGNKNWKIRSSVNFAKKNNMIVEEYRYYSKRSQKIENEINRISREWCNLNRIPEPTFVIGQVNFEKYKGARYFICYYNKKIVGFINYYPIFGLDSYYLDLTRRARNSPRGTMDYLLVKSFETLRGENIQRVYIGLSPFSFPTLGYKINTRFENNLLELIKPLFELIYPAESEFFYKNKFATEWEPNYICFYPRISIRVLLSLLNVSYTGGITSLIINKTKNLIKSP